MFWKCDKCGHTQPAHPLTKPEDMPLCGQPGRGTWTMERGKFDHTGKWINRYDCGGTFSKFDENGKPI